MTANDQLHAQTRDAWYVEGKRFKSSYGGPKRKSGLIFRAANQKLLCLASARVFLSTLLYKVCKLRREGTTVCQTNEQSRNKKYPLYHELAKTQDARRYISHGSKKGKMFFVW